MSLSTATDIRKTILSQFKDSSKKELFKVFHTVYKKDYELASETGIKNYENFIQNIQFIKLYNAEHPESPIEMNEFADLPVEEFRTKYVGEDCLVFLYGTEIENPKKPLKQKTYCQTTRNIQIQGKKHDAIMLQRIEEIPDGKEIIFFGDLDCKSKYFIKYTKKDIKKYIVHNYAHLLFWSSVILMPAQGPAQGCIWVYENSCFEGNYTKYCNDVSPANGITVGSVRFAPGISGVEFSKKFSGNSVYVTPAENSYNIDVRDVYSVKIKQRVQNIN
jgi:hypothetical protein